MYLPSTLSSSICKDITVLDGPEKIIEKLSDKPESLLIFFEQAVHDRGFVRDRFGFMMIIRVRINEFALSQVLKWDVVMKAYDHYLKFKESLQFTPNDVELTLEEERRPYSRMVLMRHCEALKELWLNDPSRKVCHLQDIATYLNSYKPFDLLYEAFLREDYSAFHTASATILLQCLYQLVAWKCLHIEPFERIVCSRITKLSTALGYYAFAKGSNLPLLFERCKNFLNNHQFYVHEVDNCKFYTSLSPLIREENSAGDFSQADLVEFAESTREHLDSLEGYQDLFIEKIEFIVTDKVILIRGSHLTKFDRIKSLYKQKKAVLDVTSITKVISDGQMSVRDLSLLGLLSYLEKVEELDLINYRMLEKNLVEKIAEIKPSLKSLSLNYCVMSEEVFGIVASKYTHLKSLNLRGTFVSKERFCLLLSLTELKGLLLSECLVEIPDELEACKKIEHFVFTNIKEISKRNLDRLFISLVNVYNLVVIDVPNFSLASYPYPAKLVSLMVKADCLERELSLDTIPLLRFFTNLKELKIFGSPSEGLKKALLKIMRESSLKIQFIKGDKF